MADPKPPAASRIEVIHLVMPSDANVLGSAFGGVVMQWIDLAAAMAAMRHARMPSVTVSMDQLSFLAPIRIGQMAIVTAQVNAVFGTSMEIGVEVESEDPHTGARRRCCDAYTTFVALGDDGRPTGVPPLAPEDAEEQRREREARVRRQARLAVRDAPRGP
jgi:acyl-CoA hydrolase